MRKFISMILVVPLLLGLFSSISFAEETQVNRLAGKDRFLTAIEISKKGWTTSNTVVLAFYNGYADALTAAPLAYKKNAPILLTETNKLTTATKNEILRLKAKNVIVVGGEGVVSKTVTNELVNMKMNVQRIGGKDRFDTSLQIAKQLGNVDTAVIAYGLNYPDALAIGPYAAAKGIPILLVEKEKIPVHTVEALKGKKNTIVVGGPGVVGNTVYGKLPSPKRVYGSDRFLTAVAIVKQLNMPTDNAYLATGMGYADALTGAVLAAKNNAPLLLTYKDQLPKDTEKFMSERTIKNYTILGGTGVVSTTITAKLESIQKSQQLKESQEAQQPVEKELNPLANKIIVLDAGHGPYDSGAPGVLGGGLTEEDYNLQLVNRIKDKLAPYNPVIYIAPRNTSEDAKQSLQDRVNFANSKNADLFISIHHDGSVNSSSQGISTHYSSYRPAITGSTSDAYVVYGSNRYPYVKEENRSIYFKVGDQVKSVSIDNIIVFDPTPTEAAQKSKVLADQLANDLAALGFKKAYTSTGSRDHNLFVTRWTTMPSVLIENGFLSNLAEAKKVTDPIMQDKTAQVIVNNIVKFFEN